MVLEALNRVVSNQDALKEQLESERQERAAERQELLQAIQRLESEKRTTENERSGGRKLDPKISVSSYVSCIPVKTSWHLMIWDAINNIASLLELDQHYH